MASPSVEPAGPERPAQGVGTGAGLTLHTYVDGQLAEQHPMVAMGVLRSVLIRAGWTTRSAYDDPTQRFKRPGHEEIVLSREGAK